MDEAITILGVGGAYATAWGVAAWQGLKLLQTMRNVFMFGDAYHPHAKRVSSINKKEKIIDIEEPKKENQSREIWQYGSFGRLQRPARRHLKTGAIEIADMQHDGVWKEIRKEARDRFTAHDTPQNQPNQRTAIH